MHDGEIPALSVVIASWSGENAITRCLEKLLPQAGSAEVIIASRGVSDLAATLAPSFPRIRFVRGPANASVFLLRSLGVKEARGKSIALLEDHVTVSEHWVEAITTAHAEGKMICGGPIENDPGADAYQWALYFVEYGIYMPPIPEGEAGILSGANIAYDREALMKCRDVWESAFYETDVNAALLRAGHTLTLLPTACVSSRLRMPLREALHHLFTGGAHYGCFRKSRTSWHARPFWFFAALVIPFVLLLRILRIAATRHPARLLQIIRGLPFLVLLIGAWSAGETLGYARHTTAK
ncbi:MAG: glycosyltransferase family 2 protein [Chthoniobacterales bacterium]